MAEAKKPDSHPAPQDATPTSDAVKPEDDQTPAPQAQLTEGAKDPMKRQPGEAPLGAVPNPPEATKASEDRPEGDYVLTKDYWDGSMLFPKGRTVHFEKDMAPKGSKLKK